MPDLKPRSRLVLLVVLAVAAGVLSSQLGGPRTPPEATPAAAVSAAAPIAPASASEPRLGAQATLSSAVVQAMVAGNSALARGTPADLVEARASFEQAVKLDERYAPAHASLAHALVLLADRAQERPGAVLPTAIAHGDIAVDRDPAGALGWASLARAEALWMRDWPRAEMHYRRAIALDATLDRASAWLAELLVATGREQEAVATLDRALASAPRSPVLLRTAGIVRYFAGEPGPAVELFEQARAAGAAALELGPWLARARAATGDLHGAMAAAEGSETGGEPSWAIGYVHAVAGRRREAEKALATLSGQSARRYQPSLELAYLHAALDDREPALRLIDTSVREHAAGVEWLRVDPLFAGLRREPAFEAALTALKLGERR
jgi:tetratricopeptide (TPR) repeat protein